VAVSEVLSLLSQVEFLAGISDRGRERLAAACACQDLAAGETLFLEGDPVTHFFVVMDGWVRVFKAHEGGNRQLLLHLEGPGSPIAEVAVFLEEPRYPATAEAVEAARVLGVPKEIFLEIMHAEPELAHGVVRYLARRQRDLIVLLTRMTFHDVLERLVVYLVERLEAEGQGFTLPTNSELAAVLGTVPEIVSRKLWKLYREGLIELEGRRVYVTEPAYLMAKFLPPKRGRRRSSGSGAGGKRG